VIRRIQFKSKDAESVKVIRDRSSCHRQQKGTRDTQLRFNHRCQRRYAPMVFGIIPERVPKALRHV
jgi:hypothetical protein